MFEHISECCCFMEMTLPMTHLFQDFFLMQNLIARYHFLRLYNKLPDSVIYIEDHLDFMILSADRDGLEANLTWCHLGLPSPRSSFKVLCFCEWHLGLAEKLCLSFSLYCLCMIPSTRPSLLDQGGSSYSFRLMMGFTSTGHQSKANSDSTAREINSASQWGGA